MSILTMIKNTKQIHSKEIVFIKFGKFYYCYGKDAYIISFFFEYKLNLIENNIYSCGFPSQSLNKIISKLENKKEILEKIIAKIKIIDFLLNLCYDKEIINSKKYMKFGTKMDDILKYAFGWLKSIKE